jgi:clathrin heavy chain
VYTHAINLEWLVTFFGTLSADNCLTCLSLLMDNAARQPNLQIVVKVATTYDEQLGSEELIALFEKYRSWDGMFHYLGGVVNVSENPQVHFKYIQAAVETRQFNEVERVCRDSTAYDAAEVKDFLMAAKIDPRPLIHVCDRYNFVEDLTSYLHQNNLDEFLKVYVKQVSPQKTPQVIGKLLDLDTNEDLIREILNSVRNQCPVEPLVDEVDKRNRLRMLQPWLEARIAEGNTETATHNAIGKLYIRMNKNPQEFLTNNRFYDSMVVGKFCEKLDPYLSYLAYKRAWGACDEELIAMTTRNSLFKDQARYLVERQSMELWATVLTDENEFKAQLVEEVVGTALPESKNPEEVGTTVKAFMSADLPNELIELLEKIVLQGSDFSDNRNLQNLLILTAIKAVPERVMDYIQRLDNFDGPDIAKIASSEQYELFEEAFVIYDKFKNYSEAIDVLLQSLDNIERGREYALRVDTADVWSRVGRAQLEALMVEEAIASFIKADDPEQFVEVIRIAEDSALFEPLINYLQMSRKKVKERRIDTELIYAYARTNMLAQLEEFIASPNVADIQGTGDRCCEEGLFESAKLLFNNINNNSMLSACYINLKQFREAVEAARKANSVRTWKDVNAACVLADEFRLAAICGLHIIVSPDHLEELIFHYENAGHFEHLIDLLEQGLGLESAHTGIFTELGVMYSKYKPEKLMEHCKIFWSRVNLPKLIRACEAGRHWLEATYLEVENGEFDQGAKLMMDHSPIAFVHEKFLTVIQKVRNSELYYKAIQFYLDLDASGGRNR